MRYKRCVYLSTCSSFVHFGTCLVSSKWNHISRVRITISLLSVSSDPARESVCPPVAMERGVELLCRLFERWDQVPSGFLTLMEWLLGDEGEGDQQTLPDQASSLVSFSSITGVNDMRAGAYWQIWLLHFGTRRSYSKTVCETWDSSFILCVIYSAHNQSCTKTG